MMENLEILIIHYEGSEDGNIHCLGQVVLLLLRNPW